MVQQFISELLDSHNKFRLAHRAQALTLSDELTYLAQKWADELAIRDRVEHDCDCIELGLGENLFAKLVDSEGTHITGQEVSQHWHNEVEHYNWIGTGGQIQCRNFTQLVWRSTTEVGFGRAVSNLGRLYVIARYRPAGNLPGSFRNNVLLPRDMNMLVISRNNRFLQSTYPTETRVYVREGLDLANTLNSNTNTRRFVAQLLAGHNEYRAVHQAPPLRLNEELNRLAQAWAESMADKDALAYDPKCDRLNMGENVARKCDVKNSDDTAQEFVDTWYSEVSSFNWRSLEDQFSCSHFAQLVWRSTREAGFGRAVSMSGCVYVVGRYLPRGINSGEFPRNVLPRLGKRASQDAAALERKEAASKEASGKDSAGTKAFTNVVSKLMPPKVLQVDSAAPANPSETPTQPQLSASSPELSQATAPKRVSAPPPVPHAPVSPVGAGAGLATVSPMSAMSLFGALTTKDVGSKAASSPVASGSPLTARGLFMTLGAPKNEERGGGASPLTANILRQTLGSPLSRDATPAAPEEEPVPEFNMRKFKTQLLVSHNEYRAQHKAPPLRMNNELTRLAQDWADVLAMRDKMAHDPNCPALSTGENVAMKFRIGETNFPGDVFADLWYEEIESYDWESEESQPECGHFTQLVWKSTTEVGFGRAVSATGRVYVVGRYRPPGNFKGEYRKNVLPSEDDATPTVEELPKPSPLIVKEPLRMPVAMSFAVRDFGVAKRRSVVFNNAEEPRSQGGMHTKGLNDFLPLRSALKMPSSSTGTVSMAKSLATHDQPASGSPFSALLLRRTLQQSHMRVPEKKVAKVPEENMLSLKKFENQLLVSHNEYRALHRSPPLRLSPELSGLAQNWADVLANKDKMAHDPKCGSLGVGENVAMKFRKGFTNFPGDIFTELWYHEIDQYRWTGEDQLACGHFTQLVWRTSIEVGFGRAVAKSGRVYVVGRYRPPGNYSGQFGRNVLPPTRVMPRSRNNYIDDKVKNASRKKPETPEATAEPPVEYAGFGTARVVDYKRTPAMANRRLAPTSVGSSEAARQQLQRKQPQKQQPELPQPPSLGQQQATTEAANKQTTGATGAGAGAARPS